MEPSHEPTAAPTFRPSASPTLFMPTPAPGDPTNRPTFRPTTSAPTLQTSPIITFTSAFTLSGLASSTMNEADQLALRNVTAWAMQVTVNTVTFLGSTSVAENRRMLKSGMSLYTTKWKHTATTRLDLPVSAGGTTNTTLLYIQKTTLLNNAVASNGFTTQLQKVATQLGSDNLASAEAEGVANSAATVDNDLQYPPDDDEVELSDGAIAGIVIGAVVFVALMVAGIYYFLYAGSAAKSQKVYVHNNEEV